MELSRKFEERILLDVCNMIEGKNGTSEKLEKFVNAMWEVRAQMFEDICSYNLLFAVHNYFYTKAKSLTLVDIDRDIHIDLENRTICIRNINKEKEIKIFLNKELSDELGEFIVRLGLPHNKLDSTKLEEKYTTEDIKIWD